MQHFFITIRILRVAFHMQIIPYPKKEKKTLRIVPEGLSSNVCSIIRVVIPGLSWVLDVR